jgi:hypothetical protein
MITHASTIALALARAHTHRYTICGAVADTNTLSGWEVENKMAGARRSDRQKHCEGEVGG